jgi:hypothetical protein
MAGIVWGRRIDELTCEVAYFSELCAHIGTASRSLHSASVLWVVRACRGRECDVAREDDGRSKLTGLDYALLADHAVGEWTAVSCQHECVSERSHKAGDQPDNGRHTFCSTLVYALTVSKGVI